jgi:predicted transcriptional regulator
MMDLTKMKTSTLTSFFIISGLVYFAIAGFFIFIPLNYKYPSQVLIHQLNDLTSARNYYTILSSISGIVTGFLGLLLGYIYFDRKNKLDETAKNRERRLNRLQFVIDQLNKYDDQVDEIISSRVTDVESLSRCRSRILRYFENVQILIEHNEILLGLCDDDLFHIMRVNSYVEQSVEIMETNFEVLKSLNLATVRATHIENIFEAKRVCYLRME